MLPKLTNSKNLKIELDRYSKIVNSIENPVVKKKGQELISKILSHAAVIDEGHNVFTNTDIDPKNLREVISNMNSLRYELKKIVDDVR